MSKRRVNDYVVRDAPSKKPRREFTEKDAVLAKIFEDLASETPSKRQDATISLLELIEDAPSSDLIEKIQSRLLRGLCSSRKSARLGFFVALSEFWRKTFASTNEQVESVIPKNLRSLQVTIQQLTQTEFGSSGQEKRDYAIGRVTAYKAVFHSGVIFDGPLKNEDYTEMLNETFKTALDLPWLREQVGLTLCEAVRLSRGSLAFVSNILSSLCANQLTKTPEGIAIWLTASSTCPDANMPKKVWHHANPLSKKELPTVSSIMKQNQPQDPNNPHANKSGTRQRMPHFAWAILLPMLFSMVVEEDAIARLQSFWTDAVDQSYFAQGASPERKSLGFQIFSQAIAKAPASAISVLFSPNLMNCLINQTSKSERFLHQTASNVLSTLTAVGKKDASVASAILQALTGINGSLNFDKLTNTKTVQNLLSAVDDEAAKKALKVFQSHFEEARKEKTTKSNQVQKLVADILLQMCRSRPTESHDIPTWLEKVSWFFASNGYVKETMQSLTTDVQEMMRTRLSSVMTGLMSSNAALAAKLSAEILHRLSKQDLFVFDSVDEAVRKTIKQSFKTVHKLQSQARNPFDRSCTLLLASTLLEALGSSPDAMSLLDELSETLKVDKIQSAALIDIILGLISRQSAFHSRLGEQVFQGMTDEVTEDDIQAMLDVLAQKESASGQQALFEQNNDDDAESTASDVEMVDGEEDSDVEQVGTQDSDSDDASDESTGEEDEDEEGSGVDDDDEELKRFDNALANVLKTSNAAANSDDDKADDTGSESSMDDEQMMALEPHLAAVFRERAAAGLATGGGSSSKRREKQDAKHNMIAFKNRVLDLLNIYIRHEHANPLILSIPLPLLQLMRDTSHKQLADKSANILQRLFELAKKKDMPVVESSVLRGWLEKIHQEAITFASKSHAATCSRVSMFLARMLIRAAAAATSGSAEEADGDQLEWLVDLYATTHKTCLKDSSGLPASFWADWVQFSFNVKRE